MNKKIIQIDKEKCIGCGICARTCKQGVIQMVDGKAEVFYENYCDGIGNCLPVCPVCAISFSDVDIKNIQREKAEIKAETKIEIKKPVVSFGCPGSMAKSFDSQPIDNTAPISQAVPSALRQWPVQIKLVSENAKFFDGAHLLIAADCSAFAYGNFHSEFMKNKVTIIGCPKLDSVDYTEKLTAIIAGNNIKSMTVIRMEVPCCGGLQRAAETALKNSGKFIPWNIVTISLDGKILDI